MPQANNIWRKARGFTLIELIVTMIVVGIMAIYVTPKFSLLGGFDATGYADQTQSLLRYAQKYALASRRMVAVNLQAEPPQLFFLGPNITTCSVSGTLLTPPGNPKGPGNNTSISAGSPDFICFDNMGRPYDGTGKLAAQGQVQILDGSSVARTLLIEVETGYVH